MSKRVLVNSLIGSRFFLIVKPSYELEPELSLELIYKLPLSDYNLPEFLFSSELYYCRFGVLYLVYMVPLRTLKFL